MTLYRQAAGYIRGVIERGDLQPDDGLPSEASLAMPWASVWTP